MARRSKAVHALEGTAAISEAQTIIKRLVEEEELREAVGRAIESSRRVYDRVSRAKKPSKLVGDKRLQEDATAAYDAIRKVTVGLTGVGKSLPAPKAKKKKGGMRKLVVLAGAGGVAALAASGGLRSKLLDALFGKEEEFEYTPPPAAEQPLATDAPAASDAPASTDTSAGGDTPGETPGSTLSAVES